MNTANNEVKLTKDDIRYREIQVKVIRKAIQLLSDDMLIGIVDPYNLAYFRERFTYFYLVSGANDDSILTTRFLRSLYSTFNNYYQSCQSPIPGLEITDADKERHFLYREINDVLEDFLASW